ncbi:unnamed protein product [Dibothriocephalus latus]|uniref:Endonuclease/exonuclease/phosphatase domain-containing protein n=1 Tax=Dibothriocephalus latus TaxID=60516 RepID=A0A3P7R526_DIBLA|nr:unnamed protein product [Dibothriocephalus latus]
MVIVNAVAVLLRATRHSISEIHTSNIINIASPATTATTISDAAPTPGVTSAIRTDIVGRLPCLLHGINDRLMGLRLPLLTGNFALSQAPTPTRYQLRGDKEQVLRGRACPLSTVPKVDKLIVPCDFNARLSTDHLAWRIVLGPHALHGFSDNGLLLLRTCAEHGFILTNPLFPPSAAAQGDLDASPISALAPRRLYLHPMA